MGQKVNPHGLRVGVIKNWDSRWYAGDDKFGDILVSDYNVREYLKEKLRSAGIPKIEIERDNAGRARVFIHCAKPGMVIGKGGTEIEKLRVELEKMMGVPVAVNVIEIKPIEMCAQLVAESIAEQLEKRASFRRAMKQAIQRTMRMGAKGIKINLNGRLAGAEIARTEHYHEGTIPLQTLRADIDYGFAEANTTYGKIGIKVWIYKGEVLSEVARTQTGAAAAAEDKKKFGDRRDRRDRRNGDRRDNRSGDRTRPGNGRTADGRRDGRSYGDRRFQNNGQGRPSDRPARPAAAPAAPKESTEGSAN